MIWHAGRIKKKWQRLGTDWSDVVEQVQEEEENKGEMYFTLVKKGIEIIEAEEPASKRQKLHPLGETGSTRPPGSSPQGQEKLN